MKNITPKTPLSSTIQSLSHDGRGITTHMQKKIFITGALPNEVINYQITKKHRHYYEAVINEIQTQSPDRVTPPCPHFSICGGCSLQHMSMSAQLALKQATLLEQLQHFGKVIPNIVLTPLTADTEHYRRKARLGVKFVIKKNKLMVGFREKQSNYLADLESCSVLHPSIGERITELKSLISSLSQYQHIPQIEIAVGDTEVALIIRHLTDLSDEDQLTLIAFAKKFQCHLYLQPNSPKPLTKLYPDHGDDRLTYSLPDHSIEFKFHPLDFTQVHLPMNRLMVNQALAFLEVDGNDTVLDLFCGIGNFSLPIAKHAKLVVGVEGSQEMVKRAYENAAHNGITNASFHSDNLMSPTTSAEWLKHRYDKILLDPPRAGAKEVLPLIQSFMAKKIVYISCNPATLARDAGELVNQYGYTLTHAGIMNMFPHTSHTESIAVFEKHQGD